MFLYLKLWLFLALPPLPPLNPPLPPLPPLLPLKFLTVPAMLLPEVPALPELPALPPLVAGSVEPLKQNKKDINTIDKRKSHDMYINVVVKKVILFCKVLAVR